MVCGAAELLGAERLVGSVSTEVWGFCFSLVLVPELAFWGFLVSRYPWYQRVPQF